LDARQIGLSLPKSTLAMNFNIAVVTNARAADQRSMLGYGQLVMEAARRSGGTFAEFGGVSPISKWLPDAAKGGWVEKAVKDVERFILSPIALAGRRADVVHVVDPGNVIYLDVIRHRCSVATVHDMIPYLCLTGKLKGFRPSATGRLLMREIIKRLRRVDRLVCISEATRRDLVQLAHIESARIVVIPNAVFQPMAPASVEACLSLRVELNVPVSAPLLLHAGRNFYKNHAGVLEVFTKLHGIIPETHLVFVTSYAPGLAAAVTARGLDHHVRVIPFLPASKMAALYTTSNLLIFPSFYEGFGYPVLEAQLCGTPVICANTGALPEVAGDGARLFAPDDVDGMAAAAIEILKDPTASARMTTLGQKNARRFSREAWLASHTSLYSELRDRCH
jgi:glycosyltransferase involved in cell wall biosynthesis